MTYMEYVRKLHVLQEKIEQGKWDGGIMNRLQSQAISSCLNMFAYADTFVF